MCESWDAALTTKDTPSWWTAGLTGQGTNAIISATHSDVASAAWQVAISHFGREHGAKQSLGKENEMQGCSSETFRRNLAGGKPVR
jgi:hypothetical protein